MTCHRDALSWLIAVKTIAQSVGPGQFAAIDDGSLTLADHERLLRHLPGLRLLSIRDVDTAGFPRGGTWERLLTALDLAHDHYVIQVDGDLIAQSALEEVAEAVRANRASTLPGEPDATLRNAAEAAAAAWRQTYVHIQHSAERLLADLPNSAALRYVRGCSGFAGFPRGCNKAKLAALAAFMETRIGPPWSNWGSEQFASNFVIANTPDPVMLPWSRYPAFLNPGQKLSGAALVHFMGSHRYVGGAFTRLSRAAIQRLGY